MLTVYSKSGCPACVNATNLLERYNINHNIIKIDEDDEAKKFILSRGFRTVPQIFHGDKLFVEAGYLGLCKMTEDEIRAILYGI